MDATNELCDYQSSSRPACCGDTWSSSVCVLSMCCDLNATSACCSSSHTESRVGHLSPSSSTGLTCDRVTPQVDPSVFSIPCLLLRRIHACDSLSLVQGNCYMEGRFKPDIVAPGSYIISANSAGEAQLDSPFCDLPQFNQSSIWNRSGESTL